MPPDLPDPIPRPAYRPWKRHFPTDELTLRLVFQQWICLPWVPAGAWLEKLHVKGSTKSACAPLITALPVERRSGDSRVPFDCRPQPDPIRIECEARHLPSEAFRDPETIHPTIRILKAVRFLLCFDYRWTKNALAENRYGDPLDPSHPTATRWSLRGAIEHEAAPFAERSPPSPVIPMVHHALVRTARKHLPSEYRPAARAPQSAVVSELVDRIHDARTFDHRRLLSWCDATLDSLRSFHARPGPSAF